MRNRKQATWGGLVVGVLFIAFAVIMTLVNNELLFKKEGTSLNKLLMQGTLSSNVDSLVSVKVDAVLENFAETTHKSNGFTTGKDQHYVIWLDDDSMIAVSVAKKSEIEALEVIMQQTWDYINRKTDDLSDQPLELKGKLTQMSTDMRRYYQNSLDRMGITPDSRDLHYYTIDCTDSAVLSGIVIIFMFTFGMSMVIAYIRTRRRQRAESVSMYSGDEAASWDNDPLE